jgi:sterol desaturase/sphingolipid hydroxylase (fatty acid hydroxylase superfamily)
MEKLTYEKVLAMDLPPIIVYATPVMVGLVLLEWGLSLYQHREIYDTKDTMAATAIGIGNLIISAFIKVATFGIIIFFYNLAPWRIPPTWWSYILCVIWIDFWRYWAHRIAHENRFWWATHVTHHNSEKYNWSVSFRLGWTQHIKIIFFIPVALTGFHPVVFFIAHQIEVLYQFWIHTEYIRKLPKPIEFIFTTPSHHRVHHARNGKYLDKNYGSTLIIWDRIFGTFQPEEEQPDYGITKPVNSYNPVFLNFHEWIDIYRDVRSSGSLKEALVMIFARPSKLEEKKKFFRGEREPATVIQKSK